MAEGKNESNRSKEVVVRPIWPQFRAVIHNIPGPQDTQQFFGNSKFAVIRWAKDEMVKYPPDSEVWCEVFERFERRLPDMIEPDRTIGSYKKGLLGLHE